MTMPKLNRHVTMCIPDVTWGEDPVSAFDEGATTTNPPPPPHTHLAVTVPPSKLYTVAGGVCCRCKYHGRGMHNPCREMLRLSGQRISDGVSLCPSYAVS